MNKVWKPVKDFEDLYEVSNKGDVRSRRRMLSPGKDRGYLHVTLFREGKRTMKKVHRLVAEAFIPNPENKPHINHIDKVRDNNFDWNLEWCTPQENVEHSKAKHYKLIDSQGWLVEIFNLRKFCRDNNLCRTRVYALLNGKIKNYKGWTFYE